MFKWRNFFFNSLSTKNHPVRYISNHAVDKDVQSILLPLNLIQHIMLCPKYRIKNNLIYPNSYFSNFISTIGTLVFILIFLYRLYIVSLIKDNLGRTTFIYLISYFDFIYYSFGFVINFVIGLIYSDKSIQFVLTFQKVQRFLNDETNFRRYVIFNWIFIMLTFGTYLIVFTYFCIQLSFEYMFYAYFLLIFDLNIVCAIRIFNLLENKVILWNIRILRFHEIERTDPSYGKKLFQAYFNILKCYEIHKVCVQQFVSTRKLF